MKSWIDKVIPTGTLVVFAINPPEQQDHAGIWQWALGLLLGKSECGEKYKVLYNGELYECSGEWIDRADEVDPFIYRLATERDRSRSPARL